MDVRTAGPTGEELRRRLTRVLTLSGSLAAGAVFMVAGLRPHDGALAGSLVSGGMAVLCGALLLLGATSRSERARRAQQLVGVGVVVWGLGRALVGLAAAGGATFPTVGDALTAIASPFGFAGLLVVLRGGGRRAGGLRFALDAGFLGTTTALVLWPAVFSSVLLQDGLSVADLTAALMVLLEVTIGALLLLAYLRDLDRGLLLALVGMVLYCVADLATIRTVAQASGPGPWEAAVLWCLAWPCIAVGLMHCEPVLRRDDAWYDADTRVTTATGALSTVAICLFLVTLARTPGIDAVSVAIGMLALVAFGVREGVAGLYRRRLFGILTEYAVRDPLTGLLNRRGLSSAVQQAGRSRAAGLLTLDLDGFKEVNDILGHGRGDELLVAVSRQAESAVPAGALVFRIGGDEFAIVVPGRISHVECVATALLDAVRQAADDVRGASAVGVTASVGIAMISQPAELPAAGVDADPGGDEVRAESDGLGVLVESSAALRAAKQAGRDRVVVYDGDVAAAHRRALLVERRLHVAVANRDIDVHYQPIVNLNTGRVVAVEALARWTDPVVGRVAPDEFIPLAEQAGLISALGDSVLRRAVADLVAVSGDLPDVSVAVNASAVQVRRPGYADQVLDVAREAGLAPERLTIEVTESLFVDADDPAVTQLALLREHGLDIAIDDFGSGFSALSYLSRLPASVLKVDRSLTQQLIGDPRSRAVLDAVAALARVMPMWVVVEGIETPEVEDIVIASGSGNGQGWLYAPAVPIDQLVGTVQRIEGRHASVSA